jgi:hypothetical protein
MEAYNKSVVESFLAQLDVRAFEWAATGLKPNANSPSAPRRFYQPVRTHKSLSWALSTATPTQICVWKHQPDGESFQPMGGDRDIGPPLSSSSSNVAYVLSWSLATNDAKMDARCTASVEIGDGRGLTLVALSSKSCRIAAAAFIPRFLYFFPTFVDNLTCGISVQ